MKKKLTSLWFILLMAVLALTGCQSQASASDLAQTPEPGSANSPTSTVAEGRLLPIQSVDLSFSSPGRVAEILVQAGEQVRRGQTLARLELETLVTRQAALSAAQSELLNAQQALAALQDGAPAALSQAAYTISNLKTQIDAARQAVDELENPDEESEGELDEDTLDLLIAEKEAHSALLEQQLADAEAYAQKIQPDGIDPDLKAAAKARLSAAQAQVASAEAALQPVTLLAPWDGVLADFDLTLGQWVTPGAPVASLADYSAWVIETDNLTEYQVSGLSTGDSVQATLDALPGVVLEGTIASIAQKYEEKRGDITYTVVISLETLDSAMRWGMTAAVSFER